jgi:hypothetical protein
MTKFLNDRIAEASSVPGMGRVAAFWHKVARESFVSHADAATLEMFEGITMAQLNDALYRYDSAGNKVVL